MERVKERKIETDGLSAVQILAGHVSYLQTVYTSIGLYLIVE